MGHCYTKAGVLCCDVCGSNGGVRKRPCPWGWCPAVAACPTCWQKIRAEGRWDKQSHASCRTHRIKSAVNRFLGQRLMDEGVPVLRAACSVSNRQQLAENEVEVIFEHNDGEDRMDTFTVMLGTVYDQRVTGEVWTLPMFEKYGEVRVTFTETAQGAAHVEPAPRDKWLRDELTALGVWSPPNVKCGTVIKTYAAAVRPYGMVSRWRVADPKKHTAFAITADGCQAGPPMGYRLSAGLWASLRVVSA